MRVPRYPFTIHCGTHGWNIPNEDALRRLAEKETSLTPGFCRTEDLGVLLQVLLNQTGGEIETS